jgi:hypothetical protein
MRRHSDAQQVKEAQQLARDHGMFVVDKGTRYLLYRKMPHRNVFIGTRGSPAALLKFVSDCAGSQPANRRAA